MESRIQRLLITAALACIGSLGALPAAAADTDGLELEPLIVREPERREIDVDKIDNENFEIGAYGGMMNIEDFGSQPVYGVRVAYHVTEDFFVEAQYGQSELGLTSFERLSGGARIFTDEEREFEYYNLSVGWNIFPGEAFIASRWAFKGGLYFLAGAGSSQFGGDQRFTINGGVGYRFVTTDWMSLRVDVRDHVFATNVLGAEETKHNIEFSGALTFFF